MRRRLTPNIILVATAAAAALLLSVVHPSPQGLMSFGIGEPVVRAAPGAAVPAGHAKHDLAALKIFNRTLVRIRDSYVDPSRINPKKMLYAALDSVQFNIPEVLVEPEPKRNKIVVQVNNKKEQFSTADVDSPWRLSGRLKKIFRFIQANMNPGANLAAVEYAAVNGMLSTLDPHSILLDPEMAREMDVNTSGKFGGLGIVIRMIKRKLTVVRPMKGTPAFQAGVKAGDVIVRINDDITDNLTLQEAVDRMRGDPGTKVTIWVARKGQPKPLRFDITRAVIRVNSVKSRMLSKNVGYIQIVQFASTTGAEVDKALHNLKAQGARAFVLDLRGNPGGLLEQAIQVADLFLDKGTIVTTVSGREREPRRATRKGTDSTSPLAVLVNGSSASASEIVAGALKNLDRAVLIGRTTFGKGSVQILYDNSDGSKLKLTIAQYLTPGDRSIQTLGITPNIELRRMYVPDENKDASDQIMLMPPSHSYREIDLKAHLLSRYAVKQPKPNAKLRYLYEPPKQKAAASGHASSLFDDDNDNPLASDAFVEDFPIDLARDILATAGHASARATVAAAKPLLARRRIVEQKKLAAALGHLNVDWSRPPTRSGPHASLKAQFQIQGDIHQVKAGQDIELVGTVTNTGTQPAYQVHARVASDDPVFEDTELVFGEIAPGQSRTWTTHLEVPPDARDRLDVLKFHVYAARGADADAPPLRVRVLSAPRPVFAYSYQLIDEGNGDGLVETGETHRLRVTIKNTGAGIAKKTTAILRNDSGEGVHVRKGRFELGALAPGKSRTVEFVFNVAPQFHPKNNQLIMEMTVYDSVMRESVDQKLRYPLHSQSAGPAQASEYVRAVRDDTPIREGADAHAARVAIAHAGAVLHVTGKEGGFLRVSFDGGLPGFVDASSVRRARRHPTDADAVVPVWQVTPPTLSLNVPSYETKSAHYQLNGSATDVNRVEDVYIFVSNEDAKEDGRKVFYKSNRGGKTPRSLAFDPEIPLLPGTNRITVVAREDDDVKSSHTMYIYRDPPSETAATAPRP